MARSPPKSSRRSLRQKPFGIATMPQMPSVTSIPAFLLITVAAAVAIAAILWHNRRSDSDSANSIIHVAFLGNSMLYFNDSPRMLERLLSLRFAIVIQNSCLYPGGSLPKLWRKGNGMATKFHTQSARKTDGSYDIGAASVSELLSQQPWEFVVMNDHTQAPVRPHTKNATIQFLTDHYVELLRGKTVVLVQTPAYRFPAMLGTEDMADFEAFSNRLRDGYVEYARVLDQQGVAVKVAPVGEAFRMLYHQNRQLWERLYSWDGFHPSPHGTWLQVCVLYCTITQEIPPVRYESDWYKSSRFMQPPDEDPMPLPTFDEAMELRRIAALVCGVPDHVSNL